MGWFFRGMSCTLAAMVRSQNSTAVWCDRERDIAVEINPSNQSKSGWGVKWKWNWDDRTAVDEGGVRQLIMVRHGQYMNESNKGVSDNERVLTPKGCEQSRVTGNFLLESLKNGSDIFVAEEICAIHTSDMTRAIQTASLLLEAFPESTRVNLKAPDVLLRERFPCSVEPPSSKKAKQKNIELADEAFRKYFFRPCRGEKSVELIVGHGNMIRYFVCRALQLPPEAWLRFSLPHTSITSISIRSDGTVKLTSFGSFSHLAPNLQTVANIR